MRTKVAGDQYRTVTLHSVLYIPQFPINLLSGVKLLLSGGRIDLQGLRDSNDNLIAKCNIDSKGLFLDLDTTPYCYLSAYPAALQKGKLTLKLWHRRLGHVSWDTVRKTQTLTTGLDFVHEPENSDLGVTVLCEPCELCKPPRLTRKTVQYKATVFLEEVSVDVVEITPFGFSGQHYTTFFTDVATRARYPFTHNKKGEAQDSVITFTKYCETQYKSQGFVIKSFMVDGGKEYGGAAFHQFCASKGIKIKETTPYSPEMLGISERTNKTITERIRCSMVDQDIPKELWPEITHGIVHIVNRTYTSAVESKTPYEAVHDQLFPNQDNKPSVSHLRVLGCTVYNQIPAERRVKSAKYEERAEKGILIGFEGTHIYRLYIPGRAPGFRIVRSANVRFDEGGFTSEVVGATLPLPIKAPSPPPDLLTDIDDELSNTKETEDHDGFDTNLTPQESETTIVVETPQNPGSRIVRTPVTRSEIQLPEDPLEAESLQDQSTGAGTELRDDHSLEIRRGPGRPKGSRNTRKEPEPPQPNSNQIDLTTKAPPHVLEQKEGQLTLLRLPRLQLSILPIAQE